MVEEKPINVPFFSIIVASLNNFNELQKCIISINAQSYSSYEILISDGGSDDATNQLVNPEFIRNLGWSKSSLDGGIYYALNSALLEARGKWIIVLGSDDRLSDCGALERAYVAINKHKNLTNLFYSNLFITNSGDKRLKKYPNFRDFCRQYAGAPFIHHQSAFVSRDSIIKHGLFNTSYRIHADYELMLRLIKDCPAIKIEDAFVDFDASGYSTRLKNIVLSLTEVRRIRRNHGFSDFNLRLVLIFSRQFFRTIFRAFLSLVIGKQSID